MILLSVYLKYIMVVRKGNPGLTSARKAVADNERVVTTHWQTRCEQLEKMKVYIYYVRWSKRDVLI